MSQFLLEKVNKKHDERWDFSVLSNLWSINRSNFSFLFILRETLTWNNFEINEIIMSEQSMIDGSASMDMTNFSPFVWRLVLRNCVIWATTLTFPGHLSWKILVVKKARVERVTRMSIIFQSSVTSVSGSFRCPVVPLTFRLESHNLLTASSDTGNYFITRVVVPCKVYDRKIRKWFYDPAFVSILTGHYLERGESLLLPFQLKPNLLDETTSTIQFQSRRHLWGDSKAGHLLIYVIMLHKNYSQTWFSALFLWVSSVWWISLSTHDCPLLVANMNETLSFVTSRNSF